MPLAAVTPAGPVTGTVDCRELRLPANFKLGAKGRQVRCAAGGNSSTQI